jgi:hypothetical protein
MYGKTAVIFKRPLFTQLPFTDLGWVSVNQGDYPDMVSQDTIKWRFLILLESVTI